jgi:hypothetical protein
MLAPERVYKMMGLQSSCKPIIYNDTYLDGCESHITAEGIKNAGSLGIAVVPPISGGGVE